MKKTLAVLTLLAGAVSGYSQGQVGWADYLNSDFQITIWSPQVATPTTQLTGNSPATFGNGATTGGDIPSGAQTGYTGVPLGGSATGATAPTDYANGNLWSVQLYAAATGSTPVPVAGAVANMFTTSGNEGLYNVTGNPIVTIPGVAGGTSAALQLAAWYNAGGTINSYSAAVTAGVPNGLSAIGNETIQSAPSTPPDLPGGGITSFSLVGPATSNVPEPSTIALGIMGASAFLMRLRRK